MSKRTGWVLVSALLACQVGSWAQGLLLPDRIIDRPQPIFVPPHTWPLRTAAQSVDVAVHDFAATVVVEQTFHNQYPSRLEGTFLFPLPEGASVTDFAMSVNGQQVGAELLPAAKARAVYENIVRQQRDPGLLEYVDRQTFRARIFPIEPGELKKVKLEYTQGLTADEGLAKLVFPLKTRAFQQTQAAWPVPGPGPRPMPMLREDGRAAIEGRPAFDGDGPTTVGKLTITVKIDSQVGIKSVYSPSHEIDLKRDGDHLVKVGYEGSRVTPNADFILFYQLTNANYGLSLVPYRGPEDDRGAFMLLLAPKTDIREQEVAAKDIVFVVDVSGSMSGPKIEQTRQALKFCLKALRPTDRFDVLPFSTSVDAYENKLVAATPDEVQKAVDYVGKLEARGGTNIGEALAAAFDKLPRERDKARPAMVLFMTDGEPTVGETRIGRLLEGLGAQNKSDARLFVFGVGDDVNTELLDRLSNENHGTRVYVRPTENIETAVSSLYNKIASPVLSDLRLDIDGVKVEDMLPGRLPDLFRGSQLTVLGRYRGDGPAKVTLRGAAGGREQSFTYSVDFPQRARANNFVPRLWATRRVGLLLEQIRLNGEQDELVKEVTDLATRYGILTPYTSYLVLEPGMNRESLVADRLASRAAGRFGAGPQGIQGPAGPGGAPGQPGPPLLPAPLVPTPTAAPTTATGAAAVERSKADSNLKGADKPVETPRGAAVQTAGGHTFYLLDGSWTDSTWPKELGKLTVLKIKYGSDAYFGLLALRDEMKDVLAVGEFLRVRFGDILMEVAAEGTEKLSETDRSRLLHKPASRT